MSGCSGHHGIGLLMHGVRCRLTPLEPERADQRELAGRLERDGRLDVNQVRITRVARERKVIAVRKARIERLDPPIAGMVSL